MKSTITIETADSAVAISAVSETAAAMEFAGYLYPRSGWNGSDDAPRWTTENGTTMTVSAEGRTVSVEVEGQIADAPWWAFARPRGEISSSSGITPWEGEERWTESNFFPMPPTNPSGALWDAHARGASADEIGNMAMLATRQQAHETFIALACDWQARTLDG